MDKRKENFIRVAEKRMNKIIDMIHLLGNLNNKSFYSYTEDDINILFSAIEKELSLQKNKLLKEDKKGKFKL